MTADPKRITDLDASVQLAGTDLLPVTVNPATAPNTVKTTLTNLIASLFTAKGQIRVATANGASANLAVGTDGQILKSASGETEGVDWVDNTFGVDVVIGNVIGAVISTGVKLYVEMPYAGTITSVRILADTSGSAVVDIWKDTYANYPPTDADSITSATPLTLVGATKNENTNLTNWTKTFSAGDILAFNVDSCATIKQLTISIRGTKT
jgi:hypothetical protein